jgi:hypothetical protein
VGGSMVRHLIFVSISQRLISGISHGITLPRKVGGAKFSARERQESWSLKLSVSSS